MMQQPCTRPLGAPRRFTALGLAALVAMTGLGSFALAVGAPPSTAEAASSEPTPITPKKVNPEVPVD
ncbi:MAG TPA: hypothetical protein VGE78_00145, partial [Agromyces sp.]